MAEALELCRLLKEQFESSSACRYTFTRAGDMAAAIDRTGTNRVLSGHEPASRALTFNIEITGLREDL